MKRRPGLVLLFIVAFFPFAVPAISDAQGYSAGYQALSADALANLVSPVALYPDPLLAQVLQASAYPNQIPMAWNWTQKNPGLTGIDKQAWNPSVIAIAHYPSVIGMMNQKIAWTTELGLAYANQQQGIMQAVQNLRAQAQQNGNLASTSQQTVSTQGSNIVIVPASPEIIYVPQYDPAVVYTQPATSTIAPLVAFGAGLALGDWMSSDCDWNSNVVVYHGWNGGWGHYYYGPYGPYYADRHAHGTTVNGGTWNSGAVAGRTWDGGAYAARGGTIDTANGGKAGAYNAAGYDPGVGAAHARGWGYEDGDDKAGAFSKTVATDNGIYNVHGGGATNGDNSAGRVTVSGANKDGDFGSKTWTGDDGDRSSTGRSGNIFSGSSDRDWSSAASNRGFESRASSFSGFQGRSEGFGGGGFRAGGGGFRGGGRR